MTNSNTMTTYPMPNHAIALNVSLEAHPEAHKWARRFAAKQVDVPTGKQVYLNTLAVYALHHYLAQQGIESDLEQSRSWHPHALSASNAADLLVPDVGRIECRPLLLNQTSDLTIPDTAWDDRVSYVAIGVGDRLDQVWLLGYLPIRPPSVLDQPIPPSSLLPIADFTEHLRLLQKGNHWLSSDDPVAAQVRELQDSDSFAQLIAQLEAAYNESPQAAQDLRIGDCLTAAATELGATTKEAVLKNTALFGLKADDDPSDEEIEEIVDTLAEDVLDCLQDLWGDRHRRVS